MIANYHTHTWRCKHAQGTEREYIERAIEGKIKILGFSDHTPMPYDGDYVSGVKMDIGQLEEYVDTILKLKEEYKQDIEIHLGLEVEYYPQYFEKLLAITSQYPIEYFLLAQHYLGNEINDYFCGTPTDDEKLLERYCIQTKEALESGYFDYFAHPDFFNFTGDQEIYDYWTRQLCRTAKELDIPLEVNFLGIWDKRHYPNPEFWKIAGEIGNKVIFGADAHQPEKVWNPEAICEAEGLVDRYNLILINTIELARMED